jgi:hypothetical protein
MSCPANIVACMLTTKSEHGNVTFRFNNQILKQLRDESDQKRISLNTLASQIFQSHVEYHMYASKAGMVSIPKSLLVRLMNRVNEREADALSEHIAKNEIKDMTRLVKNQYSIPAFLDMFESWLRVSGFAYRRNAADNVQTFVIQHDMGPRWSTYFKKLIEFVFEDLGEKNLPWKQVTMQFHLQ